MKKGWQKRFWKSGLKTDWSIDYGEFLFQCAVWGALVLGICAIVLDIFPNLHARYFDTTGLYIGYLAGASSVYYFKHKKKK